MGLCTPVRTSSDRAIAMLPWLTDYNTNRPHSALGGKPPLSRIIARHASTATTSPDTADPESRFVAAGGSSLAQRQPKAARA